MSIMPLNSYKMAIFSPEFRIFRRKFSDRLKFREGTAPPPPDTTPLRLSVIKEEVTKAGPPTAVMIEVSH